MWFRNHKPTHVHRYTPIAVQHGIHSKHPGCDATGILCYCECGEYNQAVVLGTWTLEQVQPPKNVMDPEIIELRRMLAL